MKCFDLEEERVKQEIAKLGAKRVLLQFPEGLKSEASKLAKMVEKLGAIAIVSADPCYGACDVATAEAESLGADLVVHYGHSKMLKHERVPTVYVEARAVLNVDSAVRKALPLLSKWRRIGLVTTVQHVQTLDHVKEMLLREGKTVVVGEAGRVSYAGQVIGCDYSNAKSVAKDVDAFLFVGGGRFHALGVGLSTSKPTIVADPYGGNAFSIDEEAKRVLKSRWANIEEAKRSKSFGILVGLKPKQQRFEEALQLKATLEQDGRAALLLAIREITPEALAGFPQIEAFVDTACPRVAVDDATRFRRPVLTVNEALVVTGKTTWDELCKKGLFES